ncbi:MAG: hypothetical protein DRJ03_01810 [Chloroflexi bacterium]|nr:MAG: hypothetical protein DRJ03_01810 [Chloroflexota bacterium]
MAERKFMFMAADGYSEEAAITDHAVLSGLVIGSGSYSAGKITGVSDATADGDALAYGQSGANLAGLTVDTSNLVVSGVTITGLPTTPTGATEATSKAYVDSMVSGLSWKEPAEVLRVVDDSLVTAPTLTAPDAGKAYVVAGIGGAWSGYAIGDIVEWSGTAWALVLAGAGSEPIDGARVVVVEASAAGSFAGEEENIGTYDATGNSWSFSTAAEGWAVLIAGENSIYENAGFTYDGGAWVQFTGAGQINAGDGLSKDGNTIDVNFGDGITNSSDYVAIDLDAASSGLEFTGTTPDKTLGVLANTAAGLDIDASGVKVVLESDAAIVFDAGNGGIEINLETTNPTLDIVTNELGVKYSTTASGLDQDANGLKVKVDGSSILINGSGQIYSAGADEATRIENDFTAGEAVAKGDPVYWDTTADEFGKATAGTDAEAYVFGVAKVAIGASASGAVVSYGPAADVLVGATPGAKYYLGASGGLSTSPPAGSNRVILIGWAMNATDIWVQPIDFGKKAA